MAVFVSVEREPMTLQERTELLGEQTFPGVPVKDFEQGGFERRKVRVMKLLLPWNYTCPKRRIEF
jgi:hypothetical protein